MSNVTHDESLDSESCSEAAEASPRALPQPYFGRLYDRYQNLLQSLPEHLSDTALQLDGVFAEFGSAAERAGFEAGFAKAVLLAKRGGGDSTREDALAGRLRAVLNEAYLPRGTQVRVLLAVLQRRGVAPGRLLRGCSAGNLAVARALRSVGPYAAEQT